MASGRDAYEENTPQQIKAMSAPKQIFKITLDDLDDLRNSIITWTENLSSLYGKMVKSEAETSELICSMYSFSTRQ